MEPLLSPTDLASVREALQEELRRLLEATTHLRPSPGSDGSSAAPATARVRRLMDALRRLDDGTYGRCVCCRGPIPRLRLLSIPDTPYCIDCSWAHEFPRF